MPSTRIKITPEELLAQAGEMNALQEQFSDLFESVTVELIQVNKNWSANLAHNFNGKISSFNKNHMLLIQDLMRGSGVAKTCAETFESVDTQLAKQFGQYEIPDKDPNESMIDEGATCPTSFRLETYNEKVTDAEYAVLSGVWCDVANKKNPKKAFLDRIKDKLPPEDPIWALREDQIEVVKRGSGFAALIIKDGSGNATVIFAGTNGEAGDFVTDGIIATSSIGIGGSTDQAKQANELIDQLSKECDNIVVTGYSLGGFLATSTALQHDSVSKCVAIDPPGRGDASKWNQDPASLKVTTYEANGSEVSGCGRAIGNVIRLDVESNFIAIDPLGLVGVHNHKIDPISDAIGKQQYGASGSYNAIQESWRVENGSSYSFESGGGAGKSFDENGGGGHAF